MVTERSWGGEGAQFLEQFLTSGGNPFVKENDQQVMRSEGPNGVSGERERFYRFSPDAWVCLLCFMLLYPLKTTVRIINKGG